MASSVRVRWWLLTLSLFALIVAPFVVFEAQINALVVHLLEQPLGPLMTSALVATALALDVFLPVPSSLVNTAAGATLGFWPATITSWAGMTIGCILGYWVGATGGTLTIKWLLGDQEVARARSFAGQVGLGSLVLARAVPVLAEASTIAAGAAGVSFRKFVAVVALGNLGIAAVYAGIGAYAYSANSFLLAFGGAVSVPLIAIGCNRILERIRARKHVPVEPCGKTRSLAPAPND